MSDPVAAPKRQAQQLTELMQEAARARPRAAPAAPAPAANDEKFAKIKENTFYAIMFDRSKALPERKAAMVQSLIYNVTETPEKNAERLHEYSVFSDWLQSVRKKQNLQEMRESDTEAYAQLREVHEFLGAGVIKVDTMMKPFVSILDAVYKIQLAKVKTADMIAEIISDREKDERLMKELEGYESQVKSATDAIREYRDRQAELQNETSWWTLGMKIKPTARTDIDKIELRISEKQRELSGLSGQIENTRSEMSAVKGTQFVGLEGAKRDLTTLLDITSPEHRQNQRDLIAAAVSFVEVSDTKVQDVLKNMELLNGKVNAGLKTNSKNLSVYAVMKDASEEAMAENQKVLETVAPPTGDEEDLVTQLQREEVREGILKHIKGMTSAKAFTKRIYKSLSDEKAEMSGIFDSNQKQMEDTNYLHTSGIANMGSQVKATLAALASAANAQSRATAQDLVDDMSERAIAIRAKESLRGALAFEADNEAMEKAIALAQQHAEALRTSAELTREGLKVQKRNLEGLTQTADKLQEAVMEGLEVYAAADREVSTEPASGKGKPKSSAAATSDGDDPFADLSLR